MSTNFALLKGFLYHIARERESEREKYEKTILIHYQSSALLAVVVVVVAMYYYCIFVQPFDSYGRLWVGG